MQLKNCLLWRGVCGRGGPVAQEERAEAHFLDGVAVGVRLTFLIEHLVLRRTPTTGYLAFWKDAKKELRLQNTQSKGTKAKKERNRNRVGQKRFILPNSIVS